MLIFHSIRAWKFGMHEDRERAIRLVDLLTSSKAFDGRRWHHALGARGSDTHPALDAVCAEALWIAYRFGDSIGIDPMRRSKIRSTVAKVTDYRTGEVGSGTGQRGIRWNSDLLR